ncbi:hypothetical protein [Actinocatenispora sera]|nr:hypothetical protein [Actinocatenispora sera]
MDPSTVDYAPLTARPSPAEADAVRREALAGAFGKKTATEVRGAAGNRRIAVGLVGGFLTLIFVIVTIVHGAQGGDIGDWLAGLFCTGIVVLGFGSLYVLFVLKDHRGWRRSAQLIAFAQANEFDVQPAATPRSRPGALRPHSNPQYQSLSDLVEWDQGGRPVEVATCYRSFGKNSSFTVRYLGVRLDIDLPRVSFDCGRSIYPQGDPHFGTDVLADDPTLPSRHRPRLICRPGTGRVAREFFTDALIGVLTNESHPANAEVVDGWFLAYYRSRDILDPALWRRMIETAALVATITAEFHNRQPGSAPADPV